MATKLLSRDQARAFYDRMGRWLDLQKIFEDPAFDRLVAHGDFDHAASVVELASGTGRFAARLLRHELQAGATYTGFDISPKMIEVARHRLAPWSERAQVRLFDGSAELPLPDGSCDRFVCTFMLDLLSEEAIAARLREARRVLAPGGRLCLASLTFGRSPLSRLFSRLWIRVHAMNPRLVGGCRPIRLAGSVAPELQILHNEVVCSFGFCSDVLVAVDGAIPHSPRARAQRT